MAIASNNFIRADRQEYFISVSSLPNPIIIKEMQNNVDE